MGSISAPFSQKAKLTSKEVSKKLDILEMQLSQAGGRLTRSRAMTSVNYCFGQFLFLICYAKALLLVM